MPGSKSSPKTLIVFDFQNILKQAETLGQHIQDLLAQALERASSLGTVIDARAFVPVYDDVAIWKNLNSIQKASGISLELAPTLGFGKNRKDTVDLVVLDWVMRFGAVAEQIILVTGDGDFIIAANALKRQKKRVWVFSFQRTQTSGDLFLTGLVEILENNQPTTQSSNPYLLALDKVSNESGTPEERSMVEQLKAANNKIKEGGTKAGTLELLGEKAEEILEALVALGEIGIQQEMVPVVNRLQFRLKE